MFYSDRFLRAAQRLLTAALLGFIVTSTACADTKPIRFLIPGSPGGGWDSTARAVGAALTSTGLATDITYENLPGAGGGRALLSLIRSPKRHKNTLMVQSVPIIIRAIRSDFQPGWRDTTPVAILINDYQAIAVPADSPYQNIYALFAAIKSSPARVPIAGGSEYFSLDHITLGLIAQAAEIPLNKIRYSPADGGEQALNRMLQGQVKAVVSGVGELLPAAQEGKIRILGVTSDGQLQGVAAPALNSIGLNVVFANWRGFFSGANAENSKVTHYRTMLASLSETRVWENTRRVHKWEPMFLAGEQMTDFLLAQETMLRDILQALETGEVKSEPSQLQVSSNRSNSTSIR
ncbi:tripartite tricarboxylate transporter substrate binding protein [Labrenzia sp. PHM005]|uniref:tripartite tricarboxylate transporter substrate binding protein n=1 Tax=Labrenzia sp. PHM005 TaxID=2590016 RepID=UPI001140338E|nr:tripartite tricarboxylate transporter substrate-binding protein [Labrenzia sp. PHM005]QDG76552.1 tripartite tricarboxylate transporter substrate binding protein [Labrenzia sp. PHM005]